MQTLKGRTCVFTGGSGGDGVAAVKALCAGGMNVIIMTHMAAQAQSLVDEIKAMELPGKCIAIGATEKGPAEEQPEIYQEVVEQFGSVDVVISNTGTLGKKTAFEEVTGEMLLENISHLTLGAFCMLQTALPFLKKSRAARVIFMTSVEGDNGGTQESFTNAVAKGTVRSLALNCATRLAADGITVNCISKGAIPRIGQQEPDDIDPGVMLPNIPLQRLGTPEDLAQAICFLASEESGYITGSVLRVSGGLERG